MDTRSRSISPSRNTGSPPRSSPIARSPQGKSPILIPNNKSNSLIISDNTSQPRSPKNLIPPPRSPTRSAPVFPNKLTTTLPNKSTAISPNKPTPIFPNKSTSILPNKSTPIFPNKSTIIQPTPRSPNKSIKSLPRSPRNQEIPFPANATKKDVDRINMINYTNTMSKNLGNHELILKEWQVEWHKKACDILLSNHFYIDTSPMRSGKTFVALKLAKDFDLELMVICPLTTKNYWKNLANKYGVKLFTDPINYESLTRGTKNEVVRLYLERISNKNIKHISFKATDAYRNALKTRKILLILDEGQMIKNDNLQHKACNALIEPIFGPKSKSRFGILSGTLIDKPEQIINLFHTIGYIKTYKLYNTIKDSKELVVKNTGTTELISVCRQIDPVATNKFLSKTPIPRAGVDKKIKEEMNNFCFGLYVDVIKNRVAGAMSAPTTAEGELHIRNGYFHILPEKATQLKNALEELQYSSGYKNKSKNNPKSEDEDGDEDDENKSKKSGKYMRSLVQIEKSKLLDMARVAKKILAADPTSKVVITINYTGSDTGNLNELLSYLTEFDPLVITGKTIANKRDVIIESFNNDPIRRILIANPKTISVGISLVGDGQRYMLVSPSSKLMEIVQLSARLYGDQLKVDSYVYIFYGIVGGNLEANILQFMGTKKPGSNKIDTDIKSILEKKSDILGRMQEDEIRRNMKLPSDYEDEYEDEDEVFY